MSTRRPDEPGFFEMLLKDPEKLDAYKAQVIDRALVENAALPLERRRPEWAVREHEQAVFDLIGI